MALGFCAVMRRNGTLMMPGVYLGLIDSEAKTEIWCEPVSEEEYNELEKY